MPYDSEKHCARVQLGLDFCPVQGFLSDEALYFDGLHIRYTAVLKLRGFSVLIIHNT